MIASNFQNYKSVKNKILGKFVYGIKWYSWVNLLLKKKKLWMFEYMYVTYQITIIIIVIWYYGYNQSF